MKKKFFNINFGITAEFFDLWCFSFTNEARRSCFVDKATDNGGSTRILFEKSNFGQQRISTSTLDTDVLSAHATRSHAFTQWLLPLLFSVLLVGTSFADEQVDWTSSLADFAEELGHQPTPDKVDRKKRTDLHRAAELHLSGLAEVLIAAGADVNAKDKKHNTPLHTAATANNSEVAAILIEAGAELNALGEDHFTPLHSAAVVDAADVAATLVEAGADVVARDKYDATPLHIAAYYDSQKFAATLIEAGADLQVKDRYDWTPMSLAENVGNFEIMRMLEFD